MRVYFRDVPAARDDIMQKFVGFLLAPSARIAHCAFISLALMLSAPIFASSSPAIPDTPAGHLLAAWLDAFNSGDRARMDNFIKTYQSPQDIDQEVLNRKFSGGFDLLAIEKSEPTRIVFRAREKDSPAEVVGKLGIKPAQPLVIDIFGLYQAPPGTKFADFPLDAAERARVVDAVQRSLDEFYVFPETAKKMSVALRAHLMHGDYNTIVDGEVFSARLTNDLHEISHDKHLSVDFYLFPQPELKLDNIAESDLRYRKEMAQENCGFERVEHLPANIGYLKFNAFESPGVCGEKAVAAMNFLGDSDAIIFDLRENGGGVPSMIALIETYLFDKVTHLNDLYLRKDNETVQSWTLPYVPGKRLADKPAYVLMSKNTFSGAEEFAYTLKNLKRATLIGETTGGGAHPVGDHRIDSHFSIEVPHARAINPITKTDWEGIGVEPDIEVPAADALAVAIKMATQKLGAAPPAH